MSESLVASGDARICTEAFGDPGDPAVLLIMGQMASMLWWPEPLCERLAAGGRYVIRYDNRDTGRSTSYPPGEPSYTVEDMLGDALAVLDGHEVERAHVVGMSMGGALAQLLALGQPARVASMTAISTTPVDMQDADLPGPSPEYLEHAAAFDDLDWTDTEAIAELLVRDARAVAGSGRPFDERGTRAFVERDLARAASPESLQNHPLVRSAGAAPPPLAGLVPPLLVIHGTADPLFPLAHGEAIAAAVPGARLVAIEGGGHELHETDWPAIVDAVVRHTAKA